MRLPKSLETLLDYGLIEEVIRPLMSGKEAQVYLVISNGQEAVAKIYKDAAQRSFKNRADYTEGRRVRNTRDRRAMDKRSKYGREQDEEAWRSTEVDMIYRLHAAGVRVPTPHTFVEGVLVMELVVGHDGHPAPRLGDAHLTREQAIWIYHHLLQQVVKMLCAGVVHADLSDFNVLLGAEEPVIIDFPQSINAASNQGARRLLLRDVGNLDRFLARFAPGSPRRQYGEEIWSLYERNLLTPETKLTGNHRRSGRKADTADVLSLIGEARQDAEKAEGRRPRRSRRRRGNGSAPSGDSSEARPGRSDQDGAETRAAPAPSPPMRRREVIVEKPQKRGPQARRTAEGRAESGRSRQPSRTRQQGRSDEQGHAEQQRRSDEQGRSRRQGRSRHPGRSEQQGRAQGRSEQQGRAQGRSEQQGRSERQGRSRQQGRPQREGHSEQEQSEQQGRSGRSGRSRPRNRRRG